MGIHHQGQLASICNYSVGKKYTICEACEGSRTKLFSATDPSFDSSTLIEESCQACGGEGYVPLLPLSVRAAYYFYYFVQLPILFFFIKIAKGEK
jgi:hypothetical protein